MGTDPLTAYAIIALAALSVLVFTYFVWRHVRRYGWHRIWVFIWPIALGAFSLVQIFDRN